MVLFLAVLMVCSLTACGNGDSADTGTERAAGVANGTLKMDSTVISVGSTKISYSEYLTYVYLLRHKLDTVLSGDVWKYSVGDKATVGTKATEDIIRMIIQVKLIGRCAGSKQVALNAEEKEDAHYKAEQFCKNVTEAEKKQYGISVAEVTKVLEDNQLARKVYDVVTGSVDCNIPVEKTEAVKVQMIQLLIKGTDKNGESKNLNESQTTDLYNRACKLAENAKQASSFYILAQEQSDVEQVEYNIGRDYKPEALANAVFSLNQGEITNVIKGTDRFYIACVLEKNSEKLQNEHREELIVAKQTEAFKSFYKGWADRFGVRVSKSLLK
jgi:hypothetical protein